MMHTHAKARCYADGGLVQQLRRSVNRLVGNNPEAQKQRGRDPDAIDAPKVDAAAPAAPGYNSGVKTKDNPAGIRFAKGGAVRGPGTGTSDSVPIMASHGEYVLKAKAVKAIGVKALDALNAIADKPGDKPTAKKPAARGAVRKMAGGGLIKELPQFQRPVPGAGAMLEAQMNPTSQAMVANARTAPPMSVAPPAPTMTTSPGATGYTPQPRQPYNLVTQVMDAQRAPQLTTSPGAAAPTNAVKFATPPDPIAATTAPGATPQAPRVPAGPAVALDAGGPGAIRNPNVAPGILSAEGAAATKAISEQAAAQRAAAAAAQGAGAAPAAATAPPQAAAAAPQPAAAAPAAAQPAGPSALRRMATTAAQTIGNNTIVRAAGRAAPVIAATNEGLDVARVAADPNASKIDVATQAAEGASRMATAGLGAQAGAALGALTGPAAPILAPVGAVAGGIAGYVGGDALIQKARSMLGLDPSSPASRAPTAVTPAAPTAPTVAATAPAVPAPTSVPVAAAPAAAPAPAPEPVPTSQVTRVGNSYSGTNVAGDIRINGADPRGGFVGGTGDGTFTAGGGTGQSAMDAALFQARKAALARGDTASVAASYGGDFGPRPDPVMALMNNGRPMTVKKAEAIASLQRAAGGQAKDTAETNKANLEAKAAQQLLAAQTALTNAKDAGARLKAMDNLRALQGKYEKEFPNRFTVVPGGDEIGPDGFTVFKRPARVIDNQTGQFVDQQQTQALPAGLKVGAPSKQPDGTYSAMGKTVVIKGGKVTEIK